MSFNDYAAACVGRLISCGFVGSMLAPQSKREEGFKMGVDVAANYIIARSVLSFLGERLVSDIVVNKEISNPVTINKIRSIVHGILWFLSVSLAIKWQENPLANKKLVAILSLGSFFTIFRNLVSKYIRNSIEDLEPVPSPYIYGQFQVAD